MLSVFDLIDLFCDLKRGKKDDNTATGTVKNILLFNQVLLFSNCFSSYGKETVINTCISPRALGVFSKKWCCTEGIERGVKSWELGGPKVLPVTPAIHAHEVKEQKSTITDGAIQHEVVRGE